MIDRKSVGAKSEVKVVCEVASSTGVCSSVDNNVQRAANVTGLEGTGSGIALAFNSWFVEELQTTPIGG